AFDENCGGIISNLLQRAVNRNHWRCRREYKRIVGIVRDECYGPQVVIELAARSTHAHRDACLPATGAPGRKTRAPVRRKYVRRSRRSPKGSTRLRLVLRYATAAHRLF